MSQIKCFFAIPLPVTAGYTCEKHDHSCTELVLSIHSEGWIIEEGERFKYLNNSLIVHQPGKPHWIENKKPGTHFCVGVSNSDADSLPCGHYQVNDAILQTFSLINDEINNKADGQLAMLDYLSGVLVIQLKRLIKPLEQEQEYSSIHVQKAKRILDTQFTESISVADMASSLYINPDYLRQLFKETYGNSPMHYLIQKRIDYCCELLRITDQPIHEIASAAGINNPYYFSRLFKKVKGCSPSEYRSGKN